VPVNGQPRTLSSGAALELSAGERVTVPPGIYHEFVPLTPEAVLGEVSTYNDDAHDNFFADPHVGRLPAIEEDERPLVRLLWEQL
jgi:D-lyxose ketol-isomerase